MTSILDKRISIDEAIKLIEESNASSFDISGRKFDEQFTRANQNQQDVVDMIKNDFDEKTYYRHKMSGKYTVRQEASGNFAHTINLYFQGRNTGAVFVEYEIKYIKLTTSLQDLCSWEDEPINMQYVKESEKKFWSEYTGLPSTLEKAPSAPIMRRPAKKKGTLYFIKALYKYVIGNSDF